MDANKEKALDAALAQIERQFGKGTVMRMGEQEREAIPAISTGSLGLDVALGIGGLPKGRICEIYGRPRRPAAPRRLSTPSTRWIRCTPRNWACKWTT
ncbi:hypothetical protein GCM10007052_06250 [Halioglobus japonicus]|nr:hypothetical protein GCM10007052_06250 [Halioglobus japonicus]